MVWVIASIFAALFQTIRTALQKYLKNHLPAFAVNWVRYGFGLPFVLIYMLILLASGLTLPSINNTFLFFCVGAAIAQIIGTGLLISLFSYRNFTVGTIYAKTESLQTAFLGLILFSETLSVYGLIAIITGVIGIVLISLVEEKITLKSLFTAFTNKPALIGLASGTAFSCAGLFIRQASLTLDGSFIVNAALTLFIVVTIQTILLGCWIIIKNGSAFLTIIKNWKLSMLVGLTSTLGSIGWFTAFALVNAAYVKTVGQIELLFAIFVTHYFFKETIKKIEIIGMLLVIVSILLLLL